MDDAISMGDLMGTRARLLAILPFTIVPACLDPALMEPGPEPVPPPLSAPPGATRAEGPVLGAEQVPLELPPLDPEGAIGTAHPLLIQRMAPDGSWLIACQAREDTDGDGAVRISIGMHGEVFGDASKPYLFVSGHRGLELERFIAADATGRYLAIVREGKAWLLDTVAQGQLDLALLRADARADDNPTFAPRGVSFDAAGESMAYIRRDGDRDVIVVRHIESGRENVIDLGEGLLWRADLTGEGFIVAAIVRRDTDGDGKLSFPVQRTSLADGICTGPPMSYSTSGFRGDEFEVLLVPLAGGEPRPFADVGMVIDDVAIIRSASDAWTWLHPDGSTEAALHGCDGRIVSIWERRLLAICDGEAVLVDSSGRQPLKVQMTNHGRVQTRRFVIVTVGDEQHLVDMKTGTVHPRAYGGEEAVFGDVLVEQHERGRITLRNAQTGVVRELGRSSADYVRSHQWGRWAAVGGDGSFMVIDLEKGEVTHTVARMPAMIRSDGMHLVPAAGESFGVSAGPLRWISPGQGTQ